MPFTRTSQINKRKAYRSSGDYRSRLELPVVANAVSATINLAIHLRRWSLAQMPMTQRGFARLLRRTLTDGAALRARPERAHAPRGLLASSTPVVQAIATPSAGSGSLTRPLRRPVQAPDRRRTPHPECGSHPHRIALVERTSVRAHKGATNMAKRIATYAGSRPKLRIPGTPI